MMLTMPSTYLGTTTETIQVAAVFSPYFDANGDPAINVDLYAGDPNDSSPVASGKPDNDTGNISLSGSDVSLTGNVWQGLGQISFSGHVKYATGIVLNLNGPVAAYSMATAEERVKAAEQWNNTSCGRITAKNFTSTNKEAKIHFTADEAGGNAQMATNFNGNLALNKMTTNGPDSDIAISNGDLSMNGTFHFQDIAIYYTGNAVYGGEGQVVFRNGVVGCHQTMD